MKKFILLCSTVLLLFGCAPKDELSILNDFDSKISKLKEYELEGELSIYDNEENFQYTVKVNNYKDYYLVNMINKENNHEQIILKNDEGLFVITRKSLQLL